MVFNVVWPLKLLNSYLSPSSPCSTESHPSTCASFVYWFRNWVNSSPSLSATQMFCWCNFHVLGQSHSCLLEKLCCCKEQPQQRLWPQAFSALLPDLRQCSSKETWRLPGCLCYSCHLAGPWGISWFWTTCSKWGDVSGWTWACLFRLRFTRRGQCARKRPSLLLAVVIRASTL